MKWVNRFKKTILSVMLVAALLTTAAAAGLPQAEAKESGKAKLVMIAASKSLFTNLVSAYYQFQGQGYAFQFKLYSTDSLSDTGKVEEIKNELQNADVVMLQMIGSDRMQVLKSIMDVMPATCKAFPPRATLATTGLTAQKVKI